MKTILTFLSILCGLALYAGDTIPSNNPMIEYSGRIDFRNPLAPKFNYSGVSVRASFLGTSISVLLSDEGDRNYYNIILDGTVLGKLQTKSGTNLFEIAKDLSDTVHEVELFKLTEQEFGKTQFLGFVVDKGKTLVQISNEREKLIEFIGNSITCGYGNEGANGEKFGPTTENHFMTYAAITSRSFNARHLAVCKSGIGIYRNYGGPVGGNADCMTNFYQRVYLYEATPLFSFTQKPDLICINLGTNDFSEGKGDSALYVKNYLRFIDTIQLKNDNADILCLLGSMMSGNDLTRVRSYLNFIVDSANKKNKGKVYFFEMSQQSGPFGVDYHPTVAQHVKNGKELISYINSLKNWEINPLAISATTKTGNNISLHFNTRIKSISEITQGITITENGTEIPVTECYIDSNDKTTLQIMLAKSLAPGSVIKLTYKLDNIETENNVKVQKFSNFQVINNLKETKISKASIDVSGKKLSLTFNKSILVPENISGISIYNSKNQPYIVDSFKSGTNLQLFLNKAVLYYDTIFLSISSKIFGKDYVEITPTEKFTVNNLSLYTSIENTEGLLCEVFPNPVKEKILTYSLKEFSDKINFQLITLEGKMVYSRRLSSPEGSVNLQHIKSGNYLIRIFSDDKEFQKTIIL